MRLSRRQLIEAYNAAPDSPLRDHIDALETEIRLLEGVNESRGVLIDGYQDLLEKVKATNPKKPSITPVIVVEGTDEEAHPMRLAAAPLSLTEEEILQYAVEVELYEK